MEAKYQTDLNNGCSGGVSGFFSISFLASSRASIRFSSSDASSKPLEYGNTKAAKNLSDNAAFVETILCFAQDDRIVRL